jgi:peptide deformylase
MRLTSDHHVSDTLTCTMPVLSIITGAETPLLRARTKPVQKITKDIEQLIEDMQLTVADAKGAGIAAPQVGRSERICIASMEMCWIRRKKDASVFQECG